jgi:hypothetical protein
MRDSLACTQFRSCKVSSRRSQHIVSGFDQFPSPAGFRMGLRCTAVFLLPCGTLLSHSRVLLSNLRSPNPFNRSSVATFGLQYQLSNGIEDVPIPQFIHHSSPFLRVVVMQKENTPCPVPSHLPSSSFPSLVRPRLVQMMSSLEW